MIRKPGPLLDRQTLYISSAAMVEIRPPKTGRSYLCIENHDAAKIYYAEDTLVDTNTATEVQPAGNNFSIREFGFAGDDSGAGVPQGSIWLLGSQAALQRVTVKQTALP